MGFELIPSSCFDHTHNNMSYCRNDRNCIKSKSMVVWINSQFSSSGCLTASNYWKTRIWSVVQWLHKSLLFDNKTRIYFLCFSNSVAKLEWRDQGHIEKRLRNLYISPSFDISGCRTINKSFNLMQPRFLMYKELSVSLPLTIILMIKWANVCKAFSTLFPSLITNI